VGVKKNAHRESASQPVFQGEVPIGRNDAEKRDMAGKPSRAKKSAAVKEWEPERLHFSGDVTRGESQGKAARGGGGEKT